jgi:nucleotide-binding universal stress UspA family protein
MLDVAVMEPLFEKVQREVQRSGVALARKFADGVHIIRFFNRMRPAAHGIQEALESERYDLVCIGSHGYRHGWQRWLFGSVAQNIVRHSPCSVLVVKVSEPTKH